MATPVTIPEGFEIERLGPAPPSASPPIPEGFEIEMRPDRLTWGQWLRNMITGEHTTEFPDAPEFGTGRAVPGLTPEQAAAGDDLSLSGINRAAITSDPAAQLDILRRNVPGLEDRRDAHGNVMVRAPRFGVTEWAYLNRPGASARDLDEFATQLLATLPLGALFGVGSTVPRRIATGALAGAAGSVELDALASAAGSRQGVDPTRALVSGGVGAVLGPLTPRGPTGRTAPTTGGTQTVEAAERLNTGVLAPTGQRAEIPRAMASDSRTVQALGGATRLLPMGDPLQDATLRLSQRLGTAAEQVADQLGGGAVQSPFSAGSTARETLVQWITRGSKAESAVNYQALDQLIQPGTMVPVNRTRIAANALNAQDVASASADGQRVIGLVREAITRPNGLTYEGLKELRTRVGERLFGEIAPEQAVSARMLNRIYGALTEDLRFGVQRAGVAKRGSSARAALAQFDRATAEHARLMDIRDRLVSIVGPEGSASAERVFDRVAAMAGVGARADLTRLALARDAIQKAGPGRWEEVASAVVARMGRDREGAFSPGRFLTSYGKLDDQGRNILFGGNAQLRQALDDIAEVSSRFEATISRYANPSGTGRAVGTMGGVFLAVTSPLTALQTAAGSYGLAYWLSRPVTAAAIARWAKAYTQAATVPGRAGMVFLQQAERQLHETLDANPPPERQRQ